MSDARVGRSGAVDAAPRSWKGWLRAHLPKRAYDLLYRMASRGKDARLAAVLVRNYGDDLVRYLRWSHNGRLDRHVAQAEYALLKQYHGFEKGLSMPEPRPGFGRPRTTELRRKIDLYEATPGHDPAVSGAAVGSLLDYQAFNRAHGIVLPQLDEWLAARPPETLEPARGDGGTRTVARADIVAAASGAGADFFLSRHSIRSFSGGTVPLERIEEAAALARKTPSVCNRQGPRAHCFADASEALRWQRGNRGFGHLASRALVVTSDVQAFSSAGERHQAFVDGGLYAMSMVYALHSLGYGTCMLAWDQTVRANRDAKRALSIPDNEVIVMMIAVGTLPETLSVAAAFRRPLSASLIVHPASD